MKVCKHKTKQTAASHKYSCFCLSNTPTYVDIENFLFIAYTKLIAGAINSRLLSFLSLICITAFPFPLCCGPRQGDNLRDIFALFAIHDYRFETVSFPHFSGERLSFKFCEICASFLCFF